jgi:hypothetical protein
MVFSSEGEGTRVIIRVATPKVGNEAGKRLIVELI